ncbi:aminopeptidase N [Dinoroseobacter sp. PD6]|uniref:aminopeptidase N n=1 Tax=Dinoroseobacter sp. PD6 TaxID=3028384 RepID=UPI00237B8B7E|nr:aminopeptidase N [Dinoroseobacter sp. PD6]MDD9716066.1 aminopeptidase N [Dinoroseobacter sp. PD6]
MRDAAPQTIRLADYTPYPFRIDHVELIFSLAPTATRVLSTLKVTPLQPGTDMRLDGEDLLLIRAAIDGAPVSVTPDATGLTVPAALLPDGPFTWECEVQIAPAENTALEGLYMSKGMYCTQCEAEGFRKITYYPDRPDVMAPFDVRILAAEDGSTPVLLSNGNPTGHGRWTDPWPKPAYLFALVAGDLVSVDDSFTTRSGRDIALRIWVRPGDEGKCAYAMDALKRSMRWDETEYGREYDLDIFQIVAVDDFNMGAMENKGLNIFNSKYVLASPETATDRDYELIEGIIAHEYFHNWTGNRITCRDWFQLCLKEGLTVFRDQQFSGDMRSHAVKRIDDVLMLRARQFREDAGPLAHPVRPEEYIEINNFYTATVYEKGAEVIGMLRTLIGPEAYRKGCDLYFERHDGQACTIEDWIAVFEDATGRDLSQFKLWYSQAGTPRLDVAEAFSDGTYTLTLRQETPDTPGQTDKAPQVIPVTVGLLGRDGRELAPSTTLELTERTQSFRFDDLPERPVPSLLRGFSAPVILRHEVSREDQLLLLAHDTDPFNKWEAGRSLAKSTLIAMVTEDTAPSEAFLDALTTVAGDASLDPAFRALALALPSEDDLAQTLHASGVTPDPDAIHAARQSLTRAIAAHAEPTLSALYDTMAVPGPYTPDAKAAGRRALRGTALRLLSERDNGDRARAQFLSADNMTEQLAAFSALLIIGQGSAAVGTFYEQWHEDRLVMDKWFALQVSLAPPEKAVRACKALAAHADFDWKNPNRFRSALGALTMNAAGFHNPSGEGYELLADWLIRLDPVNPQTAARMTTAFDSWRRYDTNRQRLIKMELERIAATPGLSRDVTEMVGRILAA